ncbi:methyltransferase family protein [Lepidopterella palustris CBS 459.81]|uniref:Methyltransferase family protein n=1 Tax=Lepidopterella palustris CBS 459.81 TaxID=1314670 RepID=A0A8E2DWW1_9PEZI|nr:methyltransferase family protein [Lepidopterella palustris CBS 459.81]
MASDAEGTNTLLIDEDEDQDTYSSFEDDAASSTRSITASIREYREIHGRTYSNFKTTDYWGPNDETQNEQLDIGHHMLSLLLDNKLFLAPIGSNPQKVLDVGTGTGIWAIDFADQFPSAEVIGTDLSPIQPTFVPPNLRFELDDAQLDWTYPHNAFDYIHIRCLMGSIDDWPKLYGQAFKALKPGGWIEDLEFSIQFKSDDGSIGSDHVMAKWSRIFLEAGEKMGKTFRIADRAKEYITAEGFINVVEKKYKIPIGNWSTEPKFKTIGSFNLLYCVQGLEGFALFILSKIMGWEYAEIQVFLAEMRSALLSRKNHGYYEVTIVYGQRPTS